MNMRATISPPFLYVKEDDERSLLHAAEYCRRGRFHAPRMLPPNASRRFASIKQSNELTGRLITSRPNVNFIGFTRQSMILIVRARRGSQGSFMPAAVPAFRLTPTHHQRMMMMILSFRRNYHFHRRADRHTISMRPKLRPLAAAK